MIKGDLLFYAQILPNIGEFNVIDLKVRCVGDTWFSCTEKISKKAYIFNNDDLDKVVFDNRLDALMKAKSEEDEFKKPKLNKINEIENELIKKNGKLIS